MIKLPFHARVVNAFNIPFPISMNDALKQKHRSRTDNTSKFIPCPRTAETFKRIPCAQTAEASKGLPNTRTTEVSKGMPNARTAKVSKGMPCSKKAESKSIPKNKNNICKKNFLALMLCAFLFMPFHLCYTSPAEKQPSETFPCVQSNDPDQFTTKTNSQNINTDLKRIYITFDDGPTDSTTPRVLDILREKDVKATFFVIGRQIKGREKILRREAEEGHMIGIHTYTHEYASIYASTDALLADIERCRAAIRKVLPKRTTDLYRFPGGSFGLKPALIDAVEQAGYRHFDWNASANDAVECNATASDLYQNVLSSSKGKSHIILLLHDGVGYKATIECLPAVIDHFRENGFIFCTL